MRMFVLSLAALAAAGLAVPYAAPAKADPVIVVHHHHHWDHGNKTVIIKKHD